MRKFRELASELVAARRLDVASNKAGVSPPILRRIFGRSLYAKAIIRRPRRVVVLVDGHGR